MNLRPIFILIAVFVSASCRSSGQSGFIGLEPTAYPVNFVVWNQSDTSLEATVELDGANVIYDGVVGTSATFPKIVHHETLHLRPGKHEIVVTAPRLSESQRLSFEVKRGLNLHVMFNRGKIDVAVSYGPEVYL